MTKEALGVVINFYLHSYDKKKPRIPLTEMTPSLSISQDRRKTIDRSNINIRSPRQLIRFRQKRRNKTRIPPRSLVLLPIIIPIKDIMLHHEQQVENNRDVGQDELGRVPRETAPVLVETRVDDQLGEGQDSAGEVEEDHFDSPAVGGLAFEVEPGLGDVFDYRDD